MSKTITFKPKFEKKLKELKIKTKFVKNLLVPNAIKKNIGFQPDDPISFANEQRNWYQFISGMFYWTTTPEGHDYWKEMSQK